MADQPTLGSTYPSGVTDPGFKKSRSTHIVKGAIPTAEAMQGLNNYGYGEPVPLKDDVLGIATQQRGMQHALQASVSGQRAPGGPLPDPRWEGLFEALAENGAKSVGGAPELHGAAISGVPQEAPGHVLQPPPPTQPHVVMPTIQGTPGAVQGLQQATPAQADHTTNPQLYEEGLQHYTDMFPGAGTPNLPALPIPGSILPIPAKKVR